MLSHLFVRIGVGGAIFGAFAIGLPPIINFGSDYLKQKVRANHVLSPCLSRLHPDNRTPPAHAQPQVAVPCLRGEKRICLAITEPYGGSDVANIRTRAIKDPSGPFLLRLPPVRLLSTSHVAAFASANCVPASPTALMRV